MENNELLSLLKEFIKESKDADAVNVIEHKEINTCLNTLKVKITKVESLCEASEGLRETCYQKQNDIENRMRRVEKLLPLENLADKFDTLAFKVYGVMGAMTLVMLIAGWFLKNSIQGTIG